MGSAPLEEGNQNVFIVKKDYTIIGKSNTNFHILIIILTIKNKACMRNRSFVYLGLIRYTGELITDH